MHDSQTIATTAATTPLPALQRWRHSLRLFLTGFAMGTADIVPGVSGGTIAFIFGVYEQLVASIKALTGPILRDVLRLRIAKALREAPVPFMLPLLAGILIAAVSLANVLSYLLDEYPIFVWAFFFGLVGASIAIIARRARTWTPFGLGAFGFAAVAAYLLLGVAPVTTPDTPLAMFLAGAVAICAMILPGVSGSFLLIILGKYDQVLNAVVQRDVIALGIFLLGALVGIALFSRVLSWLFARYHDLLVLVLAGLMLGSLRKVWPWKEVVSTRLDRHGTEVPLHEANVLPVAFDHSVVLALLLTFAGAAIIVYLSHLGSLTERD